ncbi:MAG: type VI secretion system tube protein Hcp [Planctomycetota bacterium]|nr:type VI secretion system tube protein Hcp [Planctomycetota bacterium]
MKLKGRLQGEIKGLCRQQPYVDQIVVRALSWGIDGAMESLAFQDLEKRSKVSGRRVHHPLVIRRDADFVTAMLLHAMFTHEVLSSVEVTIAAQASSSLAGVTRPIINIKLTDAVITTVNHESEGYDRMQETIRMIYNSIEFTTFQVDVKSGMGGGQAMAMDHVPRDD